MKKVANNLTSFLRQYNYEACLAPGKIWTLVESADYLAAHRAGKVSWTCREDAFNGVIEIRNGLLLEMKHAVEMGNLVVNEVYLEMNECAPDGTQSGLDVERSTVPPFVLISWALANGSDVPIEFLTYVANKQKDKSGAYEGLSLKKSTIHHERCRAVAELLWNSEPEIPIAQMARRPEIIQIGCEGQEYDMRTVSRWLASLKSDRRPGQPRKNDKQTAGNVKSNTQKLIQSVRRRSNK